jgi:hypothetical protein
MWCPISEEQVEGKRPASTQIHDFICPPPHWTEGQKKSLLDFGFTQEEVSSNVVLEDWITFHFFLNRKVYSILSVQAKIRSETVEIRIPLAKTNRFVRPRPRRSDQTSLDCSCFVLHPHQQEVPTERPELCCCDRTPVSFDHRGRLRYPATDRPRLTLIATLGPHCLGSHYQGGLDLFPF